MRAPHEKALAGGAAQGFGLQIQASTDIVEDEACLDKAFDKPTVLLALKGYILHELSSGGFLIARSDVTAHCSDLGAVRRFVIWLGSQR